MFRTKKFFVAIALSLQILLLVAVMTLSHGQNAFAASPFHITGTVYDQVGNPVQGAAVTATSPGGTTTLFGPATTNSTGAYQLDVTAGTYDFYFKPPTGAGWNTIVQSSIAVLSDQTINIQLSQAPSSHTFSGNLTDANNNPLSNVSLDMGYGANGVLGSTDASGNFFFTLKSNTYTLTGTISGKADLPGQVQFSGPTINLNSNDINQNLHLSLTTANLNVIVKDSSGVALSGIPVSITQAPISTSFYSGGTAQVSANGNLPSTDANGTTSGTYFVGYNASACASFGATIGNVCGTATVSSDGQTTITLAKPNVHTLSGILTNANGSPIANAIMTVPFGAGGKSTTTNSSGYFSLALVPNTYPLSISIKNLSGYPSTVNISGPSFNLTTNDVTQNLQIPLHTVSLTILTKDSNGNPVQGVTVSANPYSEASPLFSGDTVSQAQGSSTFANTNTSGSSTATYFDGTTLGAGFICANFGGVLNAVCTTNSVTINGNTTVVITKPIVHTFSGIFTDADGNPMSGVTLSFPHGAGGVSSTTNASGQFSITNNPGIYPLGISFSNRSGYPQTVQISGPSFDLTDNDVTQNLQLPLRTVTLTVNAKDASDNPVSGASVSVTATSLPSPLFTGDTTSRTTGIATMPSTDSNGSSSTKFFSGAVFSAGSICVNFGGSIGRLCSASTLTLSNDTTVLIQQVPNVPSAPTNLTTASPTQLPNLSWTASSGATSYKIYRNGVQIDTSTSTNYQDNTAPEGTLSYYVTAVNTGGESTPSNTVSVLVDRTKPTISYSVAPSSDANGFNNGQVIVTFTCADGASGVASCTSPVTLGNEGINQTATGTAVDKAGNTTTVSADASLLVKAINAGGSTSGAYDNDGSYAGGTTYTTTPSVDTSNVINAAPQDVFQSARYGKDFTYTLTDLTPGAQYTALLQFNELYWGTVSAGGGLGSRIFNVSANGAAVLSNYDIYKTAGGANRAITEQIPVTADANGTVTLAFSAVTDNALINGIQLFKGGLPPQIPHRVYTFSTSINAGGGAVGSFEADRNFSGGAVYTSNDSVDTSALSYSTPAGVFQSARYGTNFSYTIPDLAPNTTYKVILDFNEPYWGTASAGGGTGSRVFNVAINGTAELNNFDIYATTGRANIGLTKDFIVTSDADGNITIEFTSVIDNAIVSGVEVTQP